jgi:hypothetical protein
MKSLLITLAILTVSCEKNDPPGGYGYPKGITIQDKVSLNDCTLPECSEERIIRLTAKNVMGTIHLDTVSNHYGVGYHYSFDSYIDFYFCDIPSEFQVEGLEVRFDGKLLDACGYFQLLWPIEEIYILKLDKIEKL